MTAAWPAGHEPWTTDRGRSGADIAHPFVEQEASFVGDHDACALAGPGAIIDTYQTLRAPTRANHEGEAA